MHDKILHGLLVNQPGGFVAPVIPKCGSTYLRNNIFRNLDMEKPKQIQFSEWQQNKKNFRSTLGTYEVVDIPRDQQPIFPNYQTIICFREPISRFITGFTEYWYREYLQKDQSVPIVEWISNQLSYEKFIKILHHDPHCVPQLTHTGNLDCFHNKHWIKVDQYMTKNVFDILVNLGCDISNMVPRGDNDTTYSSKDNMLKQSIIKELMPELVIKYNSELQKYYSEDIQQWEQL